jgi:hypothetical protein
MLAHAPVAGFRTSSLAQAEAAKRAVLGRHFLHILWIGVWIVLKAGR